MSRYVIAVKREARAPGVSTDVVKGVLGVKVVGGTAERTIVDAAPQVIEALREQFGHMLIIEPEIFFDRL